MSRLPKTEGAQGKKAEDPAGVPAGKNAPSGVDRERLMPLYEFRCANCRKKSVLHLSLDAYDRKRYRCSKCKSRRLERLISGVSVVTSKKS